MNKVILEITDCRDCPHGDNAYGMECTYTTEEKDVPLVRLGMQGGVPNWAYPIPDWCPLLDKNEHSKSND